MTRFIDLTPTWAGLLPALVAALQDGSPEGRGIAQAELLKLCQWADSRNAEAKAAKANPPRYTEELAAQRGRGLAADSLAGFARDFMIQGAFMRAACYWEAAARIAPAGMEAARDFRVSADLAEKEAAALLDSTFATIRKEERAIASDVLEALALPDLAPARAALAQLRAFLDPGRAFSPSADLAPMRAALAAALAAFPSSN
jgi:hypothetical protein